WGQTGLGYYGKWEAKKLRAVRRHYEHALDELRCCEFPSTHPAGRAYLDFLINRVDCTIIYLRAVEKAAELQPICGGKTPGDLTDAERAQVAQICDEALRLMDEYMGLHAMFLPDRGCEGTLISFYHVPPAVLKRVRAEYTGLPAADQAASASPNIDAPPAPMDFSEGR
ncbi:MAG: hypothetical protein K8I30_13515, partial [Anaerolineae bacterium]|nr:hypothetical protein [Anaerolineae bacterium]